MFENRECDMTKTNVESQSSRVASAGESLVDALNSVFGKQTQNRAIHAKGVLLEGRFTPTPAAAELSKAPHFHSDSVPITVRFSNFAGIPTLSDTDPLANPRGMALKFHLPGGMQTDIVSHSFNGFPAPTAEEFRQFMLALGNSRPGTPSPTPADTYLAMHPVAKVFMDSQQPPPVSYATLRYFGVNSFSFSNDRGQTQIGRYQIGPAAGSHFLTPSQSQSVTMNYLAEEIRHRVAEQSVGFNLRLQLPKPGDQIGDPSIAWPEHRDTIDLGFIEIDQAVPNSEVEERALLFLPGALPSGIDPADPMIAARNSAYHVSYGRRHRCFSTC
jgi:catalase